MATCNAVIGAIAPTDSSRAVSSKGVRVIKDRADSRTAGPVTVGDVEIRARALLIATGSAPAHAADPGARWGPSPANESVFDLTERPDRLDRYRGRSDRSGNGASLSPALAVR